MADFAAARFADRKAKRHSRFVFAALGIVFTVILGECIFQFVLAPNMRIENIIIDNSAPLRRDELLSAAGLQGRHYYFRVDVDLVKSRLEALPVVKSAWVQKIFPTSLRIVTRGREPLALALAENASGSVPVVFDGEGVVFLTDKDVADVNLPVLSGIRFEDFRPGLRLPDMLKPLLADIMKLGKNSSAVLSAFSEIRIIRKGEEQFEYILYPVYHRVPVRMEGELTVQRCQAVLIVLDTLGKERLLGRMEEIDFRTEDIIYRLKEG
jgi:cell division protein FtsQ